MSENVKFYKCNICGNVIGLIDGDAEKIKCCGKVIEQLIANTVDAAVEKHIPVYEINGNDIIVKVGEIEHPMEKEHYIMWVAQVSENKTTRIRLIPENKIEIKLPYIKGSCLYAYCNKHGLWKTEVK